MFILYKHYNLMEENHTNSFQEGRYMTPPTSRDFFIFPILIIYEIYNYFCIYFFFPRN